MFNKKKEERAGCPLWKAPCRQHGCDWYTLLQGKHPQSDKTIDVWGCAVKWMPTHTVENSQRQHQTAASVDALRKEIVNSNDNNLEFLARTQLQLQSAINTLLGGEIVEQLPPMRRRRLTFGEAPMSDQDIPRLSGGAANGSSS